MKKRIFSLLLIVCLLVTGLPIMGTVAAADETESTPYDYSKLYVTDGLKLLYIAYAGDSSVDLAAGKWKDLSGNGYDASFVGAGASSTGPAVAWVENRDGNGNGVGYDMLGGTWDGVKNSKPVNTANYNLSSAVYLNLPVEAMKGLNDSNYTLDYVVNYPSIQWYNANGELQTDKAYATGAIPTAISDILGVFRAIYQRGDTTETLKYARAARWFQATAAGGWQANPSTYLRTELYDETSRAYAGIYTQSVTRLWNTETITFPTYILKKADGTKITEFALNYLQGYNKDATLDTTGATKYYVVNNGGKYEIYTEAGAAVYTNLYTDVDLLQPLASVVSTAEAPVYFTVEAGEGTTRSVVYNVGNDNGTAAKAGTFYDNVIYAQPSGVSGGSIFAKCHRPYYISDSTATVFKMFSQTPVSAYSIRLYNKALNSNEKAQNHFADLAAYYELDMAGFDALPDATKTLIYLAFVDVRLGDGVYADVKEALQAKLSEETAFYGEVKSEFDYNSMYVTDGLKGLYTSFMNNSRVDLVSGIWTNLVETDGAIADLKLTGASNWGYTKFGTVKLSLAKVNTNAGGSYSAIQLPLDVIGYDNYTIEFFGNLHGYVNENGERSFDDGKGGLSAALYNKHYTPGSYTIRLGYFNVMGGMNANASENRVLYSDYTIDGGLNSGMKDPFGVTLNIYTPDASASTLRNWYFCGNNGGRYNDVSFDFVLGIKLNPAAIGGGAFTKATAENGDVTHSMVNAKARKDFLIPKAVVDKIASPTVTYMDGGVEKTAAKPAGTTLYDATLFNDMPASYTAIRVYDRALTEIEKAQNLLADICGYYSLDMTEFAALSAEEKATAYSRVGAVLGNLEMNAGDRAAYLKDREEAQGLLELLLAIPTMNDYDKLYVGADGSETANGGKLNALWTAYTLDKGVSVANGVWVDKVNGEFATLEGGLWQTFENGGVGYELTAGPVVGTVGGFTVADKTSPFYTVDKAEKSLLRLPVELLLGKLDYTLEISAIYNNNIWHTDAEGNKIDTLYVPSSQYYVFNMYYDKEGDGQFDDKVPSSNEDGTFKLTTASFRSDIFAGVAEGTMLDGTYWLGTIGGDFNYCRDLYAYTDNEGTLTANGDAILVKMQEGTANAPKEVELKNANGDSLGTGIVVKVEFVKGVADATSLFGYYKLAMQIGVFKAMVMYDAQTEQSFRLHHRFYMTPGTYHWDSGLRYSKNLWDNSRVMGNNLVNVFGYMRNVEGEGADQTQTYTINLNAALFGTRTIKTLQQPDDNNNLRDYLLETAGNAEFYLFNKTPATVYAIRMYDATLTDEEAAHNKFVDICAYYKLNMGKFTEADAETQASIKEALADAIMDPANYDEKKAEYQAAFNCVDPESEEVAPTVDGIVNESVLYVTTTFTVSDAFPGEIAKVELKTGEGEYVEIEAPYVLTGNVGALYTVRVTDLAGNETVVTVTMKAITDIDADLEGLTVDNVTTANKAAILAVEAAVAAIDAEGATDAEREELAAILENCSKLLAVIDEALAEKARIESALLLITDTNVKSSDKAALEALKTDIADLIAEGHLSADDVAAINTLSETVDARLAKIAAVAAEIEAIEDAAIFEADTVKVADKAAVAALQARIDAIKGNLTATETAAMDAIAAELTACASAIAATEADLAAVDAALAGLTEANVNSAAKAGLTAAIAKLEALIAGNNVTADEKAALGNKKTSAEALVAKIDAVKAEYDRIDAAVDGYAEATVKSSDKEALVALKTAAAVLPANLTADEASALVAIVDAIDALVAKIDAVAAEVAAVKGAAANNDTAKADLEALVKRAYALLAGTNLTDAEKTEITEKKNAVNVLIAAIESAAFGSEADNFNDAVIEGLDKAANADLKAAVDAAVAEGKEITTHIIFKELTEEDDKINAYLSENGKVVLVGLTDFTVVVKADGEALGEVAELAEKVTLKITIPEELIQNRRVFKVVRVHNGVVEELETEVVDGNAVFSSDAFSTYALTYYDKMPIIAIVAIVVGAVAVVAVGGYFAFRALGKKKEEEA